MSSCSVRAGLSATFSFPMAAGRSLQFLLPGDIFSPTTIFEKAFYFSVKALTQVQLSAFARCRNPRPVRQFRRSVGDSESLHRRDP